jgi:hypothetical protein
MRKLKLRKSTEANQIHHLIEKGFNNCECEIKTLCDKILVNCTCDDPTKKDSDQEEKLDTESKPNRKRKSKD